MQETNELTCKHRGREKQTGIFVCDIHGLCSVEAINPRVRCCVSCPDRTEGVNQRLGWGDRLVLALKTVGITQEKVSSWLGEECRCAERQEKLNQLGYWVNRVLTGKIENAQEHFDKIVDS